ncbi:hypothetical protein CLV62_101195 [Dysgonomonas alginatilytica]|uniref:Uncharacterized protein n=1 Tax=Dysgonomonas alginatilytica TaxID=1605892 RepID=A0A2V3PTL9_9BACT|nr:hypothetical protein CLV62_101195 [Dysgonomonas alginatilytica]
MYAKKGCHPDNQSSLLTLKSNTMKNTVQRYPVLDLKPIFLILNGCF